MRNELCLFERINRISNLTAQMKLLHNLSPGGLVFKTVWGFFDTLISCFAIYLLSLLIKILPIRIASEAIAGDPFKKTELPHVGF